MAEKRTTLMLSMPGPTWDCFLHLLMKELYGIKNFTPFSETKLGGSERHISQLSGSGPSI